MSLPHRSETDAERRLQAVYYRQKLRSLIPAFLCIAGLVLLFSLAVKKLATPSNLDMEGVPLQEGYGVVLSFPGVRYSSVRIRVDGKEANADSPYLAVHPGDSVRVRYKIGKSGQLYVGQILPLYP